MNRRIFGIRLATCHCNQQGAYDETVYYIVSIVLAAPAMAADVLFISVAGEKRIAVYSVETKNGRLATVGDIKTAGEPGALAIDEKKRFLFAALRSTGDLAAFRIDKKNGQLTHINTVVGGTDPVYLTVDKQGKYLLTAYYGPGKVTVHKISENGALSKEPHQTVKTKDKAHAVVFNPHGGEALIPQTVSNIISSFSWNAKEGKLSNKFDAQMPKNTGPAHLVILPFVIGWIGARRQLLRLLCGQRTRK